jgi:hypothetical protein
MGVDIYYNLNILKKYSKSFFRRVTLNYNKLKKVEQLQICFKFGTGLHPFNRYCDRPDRNKCWFVQSWTGPGQRAFFN